MPLLFSELFAEPFLQLMWCAALRLYNLADYEIYKNIFELKLHFAIHVC